jgi:thioredoxin-like negative regulator of GroEL
MIDVKDKEELQSMLKSKKRVFALFYAFWCPYCRSFRSTFEKWTAKTECDLTIYVNIDNYENPLWAEYSIESVPTVIVFDYGKATHRLDGQLGLGLTKTQFKQFLDQFVVNSKYRVWQRS